MIANSSFTVATVQCVYNLVSYLCHLVPCKFHSFRLSIPPVGTFLFALTPSMAIVSCTHLHSVTIASDASLYISATCFDPNKVRRFSVAEYVDCNEAYPGATALGAHTVL